MAEYVATAWGLMPVGPDDSLALTYLERQVLAFVSDYQRTRGRSPALWEVSLGTSCQSLSTATTTARRLRARGYLGRTRRTQRNLFVTAAGRAALGEG